MARSCTINIREVYHKTHRIGSAPGWRCTNALHRGRPDAQEALFLYRASRGL